MQIFNDIVENHDLYRNKVEFWQKLRQKILYISSNCISCKIKGFQKKCDLLTYYDKNLFKNLKFYTVLFHIWQYKGKKWETEKTWVWSKVLRFNSLSV